MTAQPVPDLLVDSPEGVTLAVYACGNGPPLLLVHGSLQDHSISAALVEELAGHVEVFIGVGCNVSACTAVIDTQIIINLCHEGAGSGEFLNAVIVLLIDCIDMTAVVDSYALGAQHAAELALTGSGFAPFILVLAAG